MSRPDPARLDLNVSKRVLIFSGRKAEKKRKKAEWEAEWATEEVDHLDTPDWTLLLSFCNFDWTSWNTL